MLNQSVEHLKLTYVNYNKINLKIKFIYIQFSLFSYLLKDFISLFSERGEGKEKEREGNINM